MSLSPSLSLLRFFSLLANRLDVKTFNVNEKELIAQRETQVIMCFCAFAIVTNRSDESKVVRQTRTPRQDVSGCYVVDVVVLFESC